MKGHARVAIADSACLAAAVALSFAWYLGGLGYYSDDWAFIGRYTTSADQSLAGLYRALNSPQHAPCPSGREGIGVPIFQSRGAEQGARLVARQAIGTRPFTRYDVASGSPTERAAGGRARRDRAHSLSDE